MEDKIGSVEPQHSDSDSSTENDSDSSTENDPTSKIENMRKNFDERMVTLEDISNFKQNVSNITIREISRYEFFWNVLQIIHMHYGESTYPPDDKEEVYEILDLVYRANNDLWDYNDLIYEIDNHEILPPACAVWLAFAYSVCILGEWSHWAVYNGDLYKLQKYSNGSCTDQKNANVYYLKNVICGDSEIPVVFCNESDRGACSSDTLCKDSSISKKRKVVLMASETQVRPPPKNKKNNNKRQKIT